MTAPSPTDFGPPVSVDKRRLFIELFAGIGLVHAALKKIGWHAAWANDISEKKALFYRANFPETPFHVGDVSASDTKDWPEANLITASFPCIDLSQAGARKGLKGEQSSLVRVFLSKVGDLISAGRKPEFLLIENVPNLLSIHEGRDLDEILKTLELLGYAFDVVQVDAKHFTPQSRNRVFIIAIDATRHSPPRKTLPADTLHRHKVRDAYFRNPGLPWFFFDFPQLPHRTLRLTDIIEQIHATDSRWWDAEQVEYFWSLLEHEHRVQLENLVRANASHVFTAVRRLRRRRKREQIFNVRFDGLASCLRTPRGGSSTQYIVEIKRGKVRGRRITGIESARLQGVHLRNDIPFTMPGSETDIKFAFGDAVCVPAVEWVVEHSIERLVRKPQTSTQQFEELELFG